MKNNTPIFAAGYAIEENVFSPSECDELLQPVSRAAPSPSRAGARHLMRDPAIGAIARDARLKSIAAQALRCEPVPFRATVFAKSRESNWLIPWHQDTALPLVARFDTPGWGPWSLKDGVTYAHAPASVSSRVIALRIHLDSSTLDNEPLRVIPGSHSHGVLTDQEVHRFVATHAQMECPVRRGGVLAMRPLLIHASSKARNAAPRRVLHIEYADSLDLEFGIRLAIA